MLRMIFGFGLAAGLIVGVPLFGLTVALNGHPPSRYGVAIGYLTMLIALTCVFIAVKRCRDLDRGGVIGFWPAMGLGLGLGISLVASVCYVLAWGAALAVTQMDFAGDYARMLVAQKRAEGLGGEALAAFTAEMERFRVRYADPLYRLAMTFAEIFPVSALVSLVSAGLLRNPRFLPLHRS